MRGIGLDVEERSPAGRGLGRKSGGRGQGMPPAGAEAGQDAAMRSHGVESCKHRDRSGGSFRVAAFRLVGKGPLAYDRGTFDRPASRAFWSRSSMKPTLILASASPRRRQLLAEAGYTFEVDPSDVAEPDPASGDLADGIRRAPGLAEGRWPSPRRRRGRA